MGNAGEAQADGVTRPRVVAVVLTWNDVDMTRVCIQSVLDNTRPPCQVVLVDNGSAFPTVAPLKEEFPELETVPLPENQGFTGGCNRGIERALELGADYVLLLNNDTIVHEEAISELVKGMEAHPRAAMASALLLFPGEDRRIQFFRAQVRRDRAWSTREGEQETVSEHHRRVVETEFAPACAVLFRATVLKEVGLFDEHLFTNWEDYDLCLRFVDAGYTLITVGTAEVIHKHGQTTGLASPFITYFSVRNRLICLFRYGQTLKVIVNLPYLARSFFRQAKRYGFGNMPCHAALTKGVLHFLLGVRGKASAPASRDDAVTGKKA